MPIDLDEAQTGGIDLLFPDDLQSGVRFTLREAVVCTAQEVREEVDSDIPKFGKWLPARSNGNDAWVVGLGELVEELQTYENPMALTFEVTRCEKTGSDDTDPYEVNLETVEGDENQTGL